MSPARRFRQLPTRPILEWLLPAGTTLALLVWWSTPQLVADLTTEQEFSAVNGTPVSLGDPAQPWSPSPQTCRASDTLLRELGVEIVEIPFMPTWPVCSGDEDLMVVEHWPGGVFLWDRENGFVLTWAEVAPR